MTNFPKANQESEAEMHANPLSGSHSQGMAAAKYAASASVPLLLIERDAAALLGIAPRTLWSLRKAGKIPFVEVSPRCIRYSRAALQTWVAAQSGLGDGGTK